MIDDPESSICDIYNQLDCERMQLMWRGRGVCVCCDCGDFFGHIRRSYYLISSPKFTDFYRKTFGMSINKTPRHNIQLDNSLRTHSRAQRRLLKAVDNVRLAHYQKANQKEHGIIIE